MAGSFRLEGGLTSLIGALVLKIGAQGFAHSLHLSSSVSSITKLAAEVGVDYHRNGTQIGTESASEIICQQVVMALPARVALENIKIVPKLTRQRQAELGAVATWMSGHSKVVVEYEKAFWRDAGFSANVISQIGPLSEVHDASSGSNHGSIAKNIWRSGK
jgi:monoamine oxidase